MMTKYDLRLEPYQPSVHYALLAAWWCARDAEILPQDILPPTGAVVIRNGQAIAACLIYLCNARTAYLAFPVSVPGLPSRVTIEAVSLAINGAVDLAVHAGCKFIWSATENATVDRLLCKRAGFTRTTSHTNHFKLLSPAAPDMLVGDDFT